MYKVMSVRPNVLEVTLNEQALQGFYLHTPFMQPTGVYTLIMVKGVGVISSTPSIVVPEQEGDTSVISGTMQGIETKLPGSIRRRAKLNKEVQDG